MLKPGEFEPIQPQAATVFTQVGVDAADPQSGKWSRRARASYGMDGHDAMFHELGGSVNACNVTTWSCTQIATGLFMATAATVDNQGTISVVTNGLIPGAATLSTLP
jgi:hypothetical protein